MSLRNTIHAPKAITSKDNVIPDCEHVQKRNIEGNDANRQTLNPESSYPNKATGVVHDVCTTRRVYDVKRSSVCVAVIVRTISRIVSLFSISIRVSRGCTRQRITGTEAMHSWLRTTLPFSSRIYTYMTIRIYIRAFNIHTWSGRLKVRSLGRGRTHSGCLSLQNCNGSGDNPLDDSRHNLCSRSSFIDECIFYLFAFGPRETAQPQQQRPKITRGRLALAHDGSARTCDDATRTTLTRLDRVLPRAPTPTKSKDKNRAVHLCVRVSKRVAFSPSGVVTRIDLTSSSLTEELAGSCARTHPSSPPRLRDTYLLHRKPSLLLPLLYLPSIAPDAIQLPLYSSRDSCTRIVGARKI